MKRNPVKRQVTISLEADLHAQSKKCAKAKGLNFSELVSGLLTTEFLKKTGIYYRFHKQLNAEAAT